MNPDDEYHDDGLTDDEAADQEQYWADNANQNEMDERDE